MIRDVKNLSNFVYLCSVMRRKAFILCLFLLTTTPLFAGRYSIEQIANVQSANASRYTTNPDNILSAEAVAAIDKACDSLHTLGKAQIAVVAVEDIESGDVFSFAHSLFSSWGVGGKESDNGLGILLVTARREIRFVTGYGLEGVLPDALCKRVQQRYMVEHLAKGDYSRGMVEGVAALCNILSSEAESYAEEEVGTAEVLGFMAAFMGILILIIVAAVFAEWYSRKCPKCGKHHLKKQASTFISSTRSYDLVEQHFRCTSCGFTRSHKEKIYKATAGGGFGGGFGGGSFGGGSFGGGFGGGSFGGGGAGSRF